MNTETTFLHKVLIIDDDRTHRNILKRYLAFEGYETVEAESGTVALDVFQPGSFDAILLDVMMPDVSGLDTIKLLRERFPEDDTPIIMISARSDRSTLMDAFEAGAMEYLIKPVDIHEVGLRLKTLMRVRSLQKALAEKEKLLSRQELLNTVTSTISHHINNAATGILLLTSSDIEFDEQMCAYFRKLVHEQTTKIVNVVAALRRIDALKEQTDRFGGQVSMFDIQQELDEIIHLVEKDAAHNSASPHN